MAVYTQQAEASVPTPQPTAIESEDGYEYETEPFGEVYIYTFVQNVNLRVNPGLLFKVSRVLPENTRLRLLGTAPGGGWVFVRNDEGIEGWVSTDVVQIAYDGPPAPVIEPTDVYLITGKVTTEMGTPVTGIGYAIYQNDIRTDAVTDDTGQFYAYLPLSLSGAWNVGWVSVACTSNTMDVNCNCIGGRCGASFPVSVLVTLPPKEPLAFIWK
jgi:hypothetical protein